ncbi:MAG: hypothetical protein ACKO4V_00050 [Planctomycetota bacterium]
MLHVAWFVAAPSNCRGAHDAGAAPSIGIMYLMITLGAAFGFTALGRVPLLFQRVEWLLDDGLWLIDPLERPLVDGVSMIVGSGGVW